MKTAFNPYAIEERYTLDYLCFLAHRQRPRSLRIFTRQPEVAVAIVRRLAPTGADLLVESEAIAASVKDSLGLEVGSPSPHFPDVVVCPWLTERDPPDGAVLIGSVHNALSYKTLRSPGGVRTIAPLVLRRFEARYDIHARIGFLPPFAIGLFSASALGRRWHPSYGYFFTDLAMKQLFTSGPFWRLSYVVLFSAKRR
jgi:hypothetical protein